MKVYFPGGFTNRLKDTDKVKNRVHVNVGHICGPCPMRVPGTDIF